MLELRNVKKQYKDFELDCSMRVPAGTVVGLIGANGAGKSTAFKSILNLIHKDSGEITLFGKDASALTTKEREKLGVVLADSGVSGYLTVKDVISIFEHLYSEFDKEGFLKGCEQFRIPMDKKIKEFSTGMKRKLQVLLAISHNADLLILDEPTSGMDVIAREELLDMLRVYMETEDRAILISSHISSDLEGICDELYMIDRGKIILHEETDVLLDEYGMMKVTEEQYRDLDKRHILRYKKESYGYSLLTDKKQYYLANYPQIVMEKGNIDELITMMIRGNK